MKNISNKKLMLTTALLVLIVAFSGCIGGDGAVTPRGAGIDALDLMIDTEGRTTFDSMEPFIITVFAENEGEFDAENVEARLQGYDGITSAEDIVLSELIPLSPSDLAKPNPEQELPGDSGTLDWDVYAPYVSTDAPDREIILTGEVFYDYKSLASQTLVVATAEHIEKLAERGEDLPVTPETDALNGPVSIDMEAPDPYVKLSDSQTEFRIKITIDNDGSGNLYNKDMEEYDYLNKVVLKLPEGIGVVEGPNCDFELEGGSAGASGEKTLVIDEGNKLRLIEGGARRDLHCRLVAYEDYVGGYNTFTLSASIYYTYLQDVSKKLIIKSSEEIPLRLNIIEPKDEEEWGGITEHVYFELFYHNERVTDSDISSADLKEDVEITLDEKSADLKVLSYDSTNKYWKAYVEPPSMGASKGPFDLMVEVEYQGHTVHDTERDAVTYP